MGLQKQLDEWSDVRDPSATPCNALVPQKLEAALCYTEGAVPEVLLVETVQEDDAIATVDFPARCEYRPALDASLVASCCLLPA